MVPYSYCVKVAKVYNFEDFLLNVRICQLAMSRCQKIYRYNLKTNMKNGKNNQI